MVAPECGSRHADRAAGAIISCRGRQATSRQIQKVDERTCGNGPARQCAHTRACTPKTCQNSWSKFVDAKLYPDVFSAPDQSTAERGPGQCSSQVVTD